jgi:diadenosine tetraphosphate (Ap4A) HIT family hydrolase
MAEQNCLACDVNAGKVMPPGGLLHRDDLWVVDHIVGLKPEDRIPCLGFLIICPVRHVEHIHLLTDEEQISFGLLLADVTNALAGVMRPEKIHVCSFGEDVRHVHWYAIPRLSGMPKSGLGLLHEIFVDKRWTCTPEAASAAALKIKAELERLVASRGGPQGMPYSHMF